MPLPNHIERNYICVLKAVMREVEAAIKGVDDPRRIIRILTQISTQPAFQQYCTVLAMKMTTQILNQDSKTWREAARNASRGSEIYSAIMEELKGSRINTIFRQKTIENARLIQSLPLQSAEEFIHQTQEMSMKGMRADQIASVLRGKYKNLTEARVQLIARTEVSKTQTALTQARAQNLGLSWYVWRTSEDGRVRKTHEHMNGVLVRWNDPPSPEQLAGKKSYGKYHAGDTFNCRCYPEPMVDVALLEFPRKVYYDGRIQNMTQAQFEKIA